MSSDLVDTVPRMEYVDRHELLRSLLTTEEFRERRQEQLNYSTTVYVGNLSFYTAEEQVYNHFSPCGHIRDIVMGLNEVTRCPCGFCFVVFESQAAAVLAVQVLNGSLLDDRVVSVSWDVGCDGSRRWGRGAHGGQVVDGVRQNLDEGRGGLGALRRDALGVAASTAEEGLIAYEWVEVPPKRRGAHTK
ncbi:nuclear cap binding protein, putative [Leishmania tarentolae]|uniref:Nuclear cap-binding protein subunit 2 n=1 Tax=Leishmania tarentolae TaxID=5689 RepID=A0A640KT37_LEITA|nr:nuclear cap binding protein, putative [Leishmania tarentolae]